MLLRRLALLLSLILLPWGSVAPLAAASVDKDATGRVFEYRIYTVHPGKMPHLMNRFRDHTCGIFERLGAENIGYWVETEPAEGEEPKLHYIIAHPSREAAATFWSTFSADPAWQAAYQASIADGKIVQKVDKMFLAAVDFSAIK